MRTTIRMDDDLLEAAKTAAIGAGQTLTSFIEDSVRRQLAAQQDVETSEPTPLPMVSGDGLLPGVDLDNNATLLELMGMSA
ncbi:MAG: CopG family transcriptional regulator [Acidimicrobiia bacterium]